MNAEGARRLGGAMEQALARLGAAPTPRQAVSAGVVRSTSRTSGGYGTVHESLDVTTALIM